MSFSQGVGYVKKILIEASLMFSVDVDAWNLMLKPEKNFVETIKISGITAGMCFETTL